MELLWHVLSLLWIAAVVWWYRRWQAAPPGPIGLPLLGYLPFLDAHAPYKTLQRLASRYGPIYSLQLGGVRTVVLADATLVREFLKRAELCGRAPLYVTHGIMGGWGLICAEGALWKDQRRHTVDGLKRLGMIRKECASRANLERRVRAGVERCVRWFADEAARGDAFDPLPALQHTLGNIINDLVFGVTYARDDPTWLYLQELQEEGLKLIGISGVVNFMPLLRFLPGNRKSIRFLLDGKAKTHAIYNRLIDDSLRRREQQRNGSGDDAQVADHDGCMLQYFLEEQERRSADDTPAGRQSAECIYNRTQLLHLLADLFGAGVDTTLTTLRWLLLYMARNQAVQRRLREQLLRARSVDGSIAELEQIAYLRACIAEVQRIRTVVPLGIPHGAVRDLELCGYRLPERCMILPLLWAVHMNPAVWPQPEEFRPQRFLSEDSVDGVFQAPPQFMPFQTGQRMCIGEELARMLLLLYASSIFSNFTVTLAPACADMSLDGEPGITLAPAAYAVILEPLAQRR